MRTDTHQLSGGARETENGVEREWMPDQPGPELDDLLPYKSPLYSSSPP